MRDHAFVIALALLAGVLVLLGDLAGDRLALDRAAVSQGQVWRLLTGHLVHLGPYHAMLNIVGGGMGGSEVEQNVDDMEPEATAKMVDGIGRKVDVSNENDIKALVENDVKLAIGAGVQVKRSKNGALRISEMN